MRFYLCVLSPEDPKPQSKYEKNIRPILIQGYPTKYLTSIPWYCQHYQKQGKSEKVTAKNTWHKEAWWLHVMKYPGWNLETERGY